MQKDWRFYLGVALLIYNVAAYGAIALIPFLKLSGAMSGSVAGSLILSGELAFLASVALLGKPFFEAIKAKFRQWFARPAPSVSAGPTSRARHVTGVILFCASFIPYFIAEWLLILGAAKFQQTSWVLALLLASDALFVISFFVLGGEFWARVEKCFAWPGKDK